MVPISVRRNLYKFVFRINMKIRNDSIFGLC